MHRADAGAGQHGDGGLGDHRHVDGHPVALADAQLLQDVGQLAGLLMELTIGEGLVVLGIVALPDDRRLVAARLEVAVDAVGADVQRAVLEPADVHVVGVEGGVLDLGGRLEPVEALGLLAPEPLWVVDRLPVHGLVGGLVGVGLGGEVVAYRVDVLMLGHGYASVREDAPSRWMMPAALLLDGPTP